MSGERARSRAGVLTISDRCARGEARDLGGPAVRRLLEESGWDVAEERIVPDEAQEIQSVLLDWCEARRLDLIVTTGGTGIGPRDTTPEATRPLLEKELPGLSELMRRAGKDTRAALSRGLAGTRGKGLIVNVPGNPRGAVESLAAVLPLLRHALSILAGDGHEETHAQR